MHTQRLGIRLTYIPTLARAFNGSSGFQATKNSNQSIHCIYMNGIGTQWAVLLTQRAQCMMVVPHFC